MESNKSRDVTENAVQNGAVMKTDGAKMHLHH